MKKQPISILNLQAFKMEHPDSGQFVYAGVLEFTSPDPNAAYVPQWMMDYLGVKDGEEVLFEHVDLPKGEFVRLQPVSSAWLVRVERERERERESERRERE